MESYLREEFENLPREERQALEYTYGDRAFTVWLQSKLEQAEKENKKLRELLGRSHSLIYDNSLDYKLCYEIEKQIEL